MSSMKVYLTVWSAGLVSGLILMERWQRASDVQVPPAESEGDVVDTDARSTATDAATDRPKVSAVIVTGAKADAERARLWLERVVPSGSTSVPSLVRRQRTLRPAAPGHTPPS